MTHLYTHTHTQKNMTHLVSTHTHTRACAQTNAVTHLYTWHDAHTQKWLHTNYATLQPYVHPHGKSIPGPIIWGRSSWTQPWRGKWWWRRGAWSTPTKNRTARSPPVAHSLSPVCCSWYLPAWCSLQVSGDINNVAEAKVQTSSYSYFKWRRIPGKM